MKYAHIFISLILLIVLATASQAAVTVPADVSLRFEDAVQRSNPIPERTSSRLDDADELEYASFSLPITSNTSITITRVSVDLSKFTYDPIDAPLNQSDVLRTNFVSPFVVNNETRNIDIQILVPSNLDSIDSSFRPIKHTVPVRLETSAGTFTSSLGFYVENGLSLNRVKLETDSDSVRCSVDEDTVSLDCDDEADELRPGQDMTLTFELQNEFSEDSDLDLDGIDLTVDSDNRDIDPSDDEFDEDIASDENQEFSVSFDVDEGAEDGDDATITIEAVVRDENGARHGFRHTFDIQFQTLRYDLSIDTFRASPASICAGDVTSISFTLANIGERDQTNVRAVLKSDAFGFNQVYDRMTIPNVDKRDNTHTESYSLITKSTVRPGTYPVVLNVYYKSDDSNDEFAVRNTDIVVTDCSRTQQPPTQPSNNPNTNNQQPQSNTTIVVVNPGSGSSGQNNNIPSTVQTPVQAVVKSQSADTPYLIGLSVLIAVLVILIVVMIIVAARRQ